MVGEGNATAQRRKIQASIRLRYNIFGPSSEISQVNIRLRYNISEPFCELARRLRNLLVFREPLGPLLES